MSAFPSALAVDPVPWARAQVAFTLGSHIILVPLGVSWAALTPIARHVLPEEGSGEPRAAGVSP